MFFWHQLAVAALEVVGLLTMCHRLLPGGKHITERIGWSFRPIQPLLRFSLTIAFTSSVWVLVTQTDKLVLSGVLPLAEYGYFTLAVLVAGGITIISGPISMAIMPRTLIVCTESLLFAWTGNREVTDATTPMLRLYAIGNGLLALGAFPCYLQYARGNLR